MCSGVCVCVWVCDFLSKIAAPMKLRAEAMRLIAKVNAVGAVQLSRQWDTFALRLKLQYFFPFLRGNISERYLQHFWRCNTRNGMSVSRCNGLATCRMHFWLTWAAMFSFLLAIAVKLVIICYRFSCFELIVSTQVNEWIFYFGRCRATRVTAPAATRPSSAWAAARRKR